MKIYTGIGSRETPQSVLMTMKHLGQKAAMLGNMLRSGGANGADLAFERGCDMAEGQKEIYLPWKGFNNSTSQLYTIPDEAFDIASRIHPAWEKCSQGAKKLHARNILQVLGQDLKTPTGLVICWTKDGKDIGGTRTAIVLAREYNIKIWNLWGT
jgi:hypothetical protein